MNKDIPAFPFPATSSTLDNSPMGMTLRDYFAAAALTGFLAANKSMDNSVYWSYLVADKMLAKRNKTNE